MQHLNEHSSKDQLKDTLLTNYENSFVGHERNSRFTFKQIQDNNHHEEAKESLPKSIIMKKKSNSLNNLQMNNIFIKNKYIDYDPKIEEINE